MVDRKFQVRERDLRFSYASFGQRLFAYIVDMLIVLSINKIVVGFVGIGEEATIGNISLLTIVYKLSTLLYFFLMTCVFRGKTLGKMLMGLSVVSLTSDKLDVGQIFIREVCGRFVQNKFSFIYILILLTPKKQSLFDLFADTAVVRDDAYQGLYENKDEEI